MAVSFGSVLEIYPLLSLFRAQLDAEPRLYIPFVINVYNIGTMCVVSDM